MKYLARKKILIPLLAIAFLLLFPFIAGQSGYFITLAVTICIYVITATAVNLLTGFGGQVSVGHAGFLSVGGYTVAILAERFDLSIWLLLPIAGIITAIFSLVIGLPAARLSGHFLAVATLGFGLSIPQIALNWEDLTKGYNGIAVFRPDMLSTDLQFFYVVAILTIVMIWLMKNIVTSGMGRAFVAIRESEVAAQANGINVSFYKTIMFVISAFFTGIAGGLYAYWFSFVSPQDFTLLTSLFILGMVVVGGLGSIVGGIIGAVLFTVIPHFTDSFIGVTNIVIGIAIVLVILFRPEGLISIPELVKNKKKEKASLKVHQKEEVGDVNL